MSSYLPPTSDLPSFNSQIFQSNLSTDEVDSKIKSLETTRKTYSIETGTVTEDGSTGDVIFDKEFDSAPIVMAQAVDASTTLGFVINVHTLTQRGFSYSKFFVNTNSNSIGGAPNVDWTYITIGERS